MLVVVLVATVVNRTCIPSCRRCGDIDGTSISSGVRISVTSEAILPAFEALMDLRRPAPGAAAEFERMRQYLQERFQVLLGGFRAPWKGDDETPGSGAGRSVNEAGDGARERGKWGDGE